MKSGNQSHILNASSNLMGICFVVVTGLKLTGASDRTWADEIALFAAFCFLGSCLLSYISMRVTGEGRRYEWIADIMFIGGMLTLYLSVFAFARDFLLQM